MINEYFVSVRFNKKEEIYEAYCVEMPGIVSSGVNREVVIDEVYENIKFNNDETEKFGFEIVKPSNGRPSLLDILSVVLVKWRRIAFWLQHMGDNKHNRCVTNISYNDCTLDCMKCLDKFYDKNGAICSTKLGGCGSKLSIDEAFICKHCARESEENNGRTKRYDK